MWSTRRVSAASAFSVLKSPNGAVLRAGAFEFVPCSSLAIGAIYHTTVSKLRAQVSAFARVALSHTW